MTRDTYAVVHEQWLKSYSHIHQGYDLLWARPELPCMEFFAAQTLTQWLEEQGFNVERCLNGIPTAFSARIVLGPGPCVGILAEYDALPGMGNAAVPARSAPPVEAGHACGHNHIGPSNVGAAIAAVQAAKALGLSGEIRVIGCPAEEILWGKVALLKTGAFANVDVLLTSHGDYQNGAISRPCLAMATGEFMFSGQSSHGGYTGKVNALGGAEEALFALRDLAKRFADTPIKHVIRGNMHMAGVVPDDVRLYFSVRHLEVDRAIEVYDAVIELCKQTAEECGLEWRHLPISSCRGYLPNDVLADVLMQSLEQVGPPQWSASDKQWMQDLAAVSTPGVALELDQAIALYKDGHDYFSQDDGEASWQIPLGRVNWAFPKQVPIHHWAWTALAGHSSSRAGPMMASEALALAAVNLLQQPALIAKALAELKQRRQGRPMSEPRLGAWETLTRNPQAFWNATWTEGESSAGLE